MGHTLVGVTSFPVSRVCRRRLLALGIVVAMLSPALSACGSKSAAADKLTARDEAQSVGLGQYSMTHGDDCVGDLNKDGFDDVLLNSHTDQWKLLYGSASGKFTPAPMQFKPRDRHGCVFADFNDDGLLDIYFSIGSCKGHCHNQKELWIQRPNRTFVDEATQWGIIDPDTRGRTPIPVNANGDARVDLFIGASLTVDYPSSNKLWLNEGNKFVLHEGPPTVDIGSNCAAAADLTHNGLDDIGVCTPTKGFHLYRALGDGNYVDATTSFGLATTGRRSIRFGDFNHDGWPDLVSVMQGRVTVKLNDHGHFGKPVFKLELKDGENCAVADADGDGNLDLYVQQRDSGPDRLLLGDGTGHFTMGPPIPLRHGAGESVTVLPHWRDGRDAFIVNNGYEATRGDRQLIALVGNRAASK